LKSTSGAELFGMKQLTPMVIDEISLLPLNAQSLLFTWPIEKEKRNNVNIYVSPSVDLKALVAQFPERTFHQLSIDKAFELISSGTPQYLSHQFALIYSFLSEEEPLIKLGSSLPRFDLAVVSSTEEADRVIRPKVDSPFSLVRARGAILLAKSAVHSHFDD